MIVPGLINWDQFKYKSKETAGKENWSSKCKEITVNTEFIYKEKQNSLHGPTLHGTHMHVFKVKQLLPQPKKWKM